MFGRCISLSVAVFLFTSNASTLVAAVWGIEDSPIILVEDYIVPSGDILTIEPGVEVKFQGYGSLIVEGVLDAVGTPARTIAFSSNQETPSPSDWGTIALVGPEASASQISNWRIEHSDTGLALFETSPMISDVVSRNNRKGFRVDRGSPTLTRVTAYRNQYGIDISGNGPGFLQVADSDIVENTYGIQVNSFRSTPDPSPTFANNRVYDNHISDVSIVGQWESNAVLDFEHNWWGLANEAYIDDRINDGNDNAGRAVVDYMPFIAQNPRRPLFDELPAGSSAIAELRNPWLADYDSDGDIDLFSNDRLLLNDGTGDFHEIAISGIDRTHVDYAQLNQDKVIDLLVRALAPGCNPFNCGSPDPYRRYDSNEEGGFDFVATISPHSNWDSTFDSRFADFDQDGKLDVFGTGTSSFTSFRDQVALLYESTNDESVVYERIAYNPFPGVNDISRPVASDTGVIRDFDNDGDPDVFSRATLSYSNEVANIIWRNDGNRNFVRIPLDAEFGAVRQTAEDFDNDLDFDLLGRDRVLLNDGDLTFAAGPTIDADFGSLGFEYIETGDLDNNGTIDIATFEDVGNAYMVRIYRNDGTARFTHSIDDTQIVVASPDDPPPLFSLVDINSDGQLDAFLGGHVLLGHTDDQAANHWLRVKLYGSPSNSEAIGARVTVQTGDLSQIREIESGLDSERIAHFGLGQEGSVDELSIRWPDGTLQTLTDLSVNRLIFVGLPGDFNFDGHVNAADYVVWRNSLGETGLGLHADGDKNGQIDIGDYEVWRLNFGNSVAAGLPDTAFIGSIPEPTSVVILITISGILIMTSRRRTRCSVYKQLRDFGEATYVCAGTRLHGVPNARKSPNDSRRFAAHDCCRAVLVGLLVFLPSPASLSEGATIEITELPAYGTGNLLRGRVNDVDAASYRVAAYIHVEGSGWWTKPTFASPTVPIAANGVFSIDVVTGGLDNVARIYALDVLPIGVTPIEARDAATLPSNSQSIAGTYAYRNGPTIDFAGRSWAVKEARLPVGPGGNRFSAHPDDVFVDDDGALHLSITETDGSRVSSEVILTESLGYGTYTFVTEYQVNDLDANATFGAFTWDSFGDDARIDDWPFREIDIEDSRWGNPSDPTNTQNVVQPYHVTGNLERYTIPNLGGDQALTRSISWLPGRVRFRTALGHHPDGDIPPEMIINDQTYLEDEGDNRLVPVPGRETFRFNLWLNQAAPAEAAQTEVVISDFDFTLAGDYNRDGIVGAADYVVWRNGLGTAYSQADYDVWLSNYGRTLSASPSVTSQSSANLPEPATVEILVITIMSILVAYRLPSGHGAQESCKLPVAADTRS